MKQKTEITMAKKIQIVNYIVRIESPFMEFYKISLAIEDDCLPCDCQKMADSYTQLSTL